jgi:hypothetical protein
MPDSSVAIKDATGTTVNIDTFQLGTGDQQQYVREYPVATPGIDSWTLAVAALPSKIAADAGRRVLILWNTSSSGTVYLRHDGTAPTTAPGGFHDKIPPGTRLDVNQLLCPLAVSFIADIANGVLNIFTGTST